MAKSQVDSIVMVWIRKIKGKDDKTVEKTFTLEEAKRIIAHQEKRSKHDWKIKTGQPYQLVDGEIVPTAGTGANKA